MTNAADWQGRMPRADLRPLTDEWAKAAMQPRYAVDGSITYVLTPPAAHGLNIGRGIVVLGCLALVALLATWPMWSGR